MQEILIGIFGLLVGAWGAMSGSGGAMLLVPLLIWSAGVPPKLAIGASLISVIATSTTLGAVHVGHRIAHTRLSIVLEVATTLGALAGAVAAVFLNPHLLQVALGFAVVFVVLRPTRPHAAAIRLTGLLDAAYVDPINGDTVRYGIRNLPLGLVGSFLAGNLSGLLGTGGGFIKVPLMTLVMGMPPPAAIATSNFMIAVTAATSAQIFYLRGYIDPRIAVPTTFGVLLGAQVGAALRRWRATAILDDLSAHVLAFARAVLARLIALVGPASTPRVLVQSTAFQIMAAPAVTYGGARGDVLAAAMPDTDAAQVYVDREFLNLVTGRRPADPSTADRAKGLDLNPVVHHVMLLGLVATGLFLLVGSILVLSLQTTLPSVDPSPVDAVRAALQLHPAGFLALGLGILVGTPIVCLVASLLVCVSRRDWRYAAITSVVLVIMLISILIGAS